MFEKSSPYPSPPRFSPVLSCVVLCFAYRPIIHFQLIFVKDISSVSRFTFFICEGPVFFSTICCSFALSLGFPDSSVGKESTCNAGDPSSIPGSGRSAGERIGYPLQYSGLENSMDCIVHGISKSQTRLCNIQHFHQISIEHIYVSLFLGSLFCP